MNLVSIENLRKSYALKVLFDNVALGIDEGDKIGLIGVNGTGKSTFLKIIAGLESPDAGTVTRGGSVQVEYLPQNPVFDETATALEQIFQGHSPVMKLLREYEECLEQVHENPQNNLRQQRLIKLSQEMDACNGWQTESEAKSILTKLGITAYSARVATLSGGLKKRVALAGALIKPADLLVLDEPTNHLDNDTVAWLEQYLAKRKGALLMVTHDRYFLDRVTTRILEIDRGKLYSYAGNYSVYLELKTQREEQLDASELKRQNLLRNELAWVRRGAKARTTKQKARLDRYTQLSEEKSENAEGKLDMTVGASRLGRKVIELQDITKGFGEKVLIRKFSHFIGKSDRIGIVGPNGSGKTTLLNIIAGQVAPDSGKVETGSTVKIGYFSQENELLNESLRVIEYIKEGGEVLPTLEGTTISASQLLERFLFPPNEQWTPISRLSGGEKRRLYLLRILIEAPNVLLLDEPTNDLDIQTLTILEDYLDGFPGAVIIVSHDRYLLDRLTERIFALEGNGLVRQYSGGYSDYEGKRQLETKTEPLTEAKRDSRRESKREPAKTAAFAGNKTDSGESLASLNKAAERARKMTFKEQREYALIEDNIAAAESLLQDTKAKIEAAVSDYQQLQELLGRKEELEARLEELMNRWAYLSEMAEEIGK